jgi:hypothetical protein
MYTIATRTRVRLLTLATAMAVAAVTALPAAAGVEQNPNALPFGPSVCDDGREIELGYTPTEPARVGFAADSDTRGVSMSLSLIVPHDPGDPLGDHEVIEVLFDRPGKGLDKNTVRCVFPAPFPGLWIATEINFNDARR